MIHVRTCSATLLVVSGLAVVSAQSAPQAPPDTSADAVARAASAYVLAYRKDVAYLLADETYVQTRLNRSGQPIESRTLEGEIFITYLEADGQWIAVHDVVSVDDQPVPDREDLKRLLASGAEIRGVAARVAERNARFNLGRVWRNFNEPTLPLMLLEPERVDRLQLDASRLVRSPEHTLVTLDYEERGRPTLVRGPRDPIRSQGAFVIDAATGRVHSTRFELRQGSIRAELVTEYRQDDRLDVWVPGTFSERYEGSPDGADEIVVCTATYTNYRRYLTTARIR